MSSRSGKFVFDYHYYPYYPCYPYPHPRFPIRYMIEPIRLYKYCERKYMDSLLTKGNLRLAPPDDFRNINKYGELTSDEADGIKTLGGKLRDGENQPAGLQGLIKVGENARNVTFSNIKVINSDVLIFSTSSEYSEESHRRWFEEEGYDVCYEILDANAFFAFVSQALGNSYRFLGFSPVIYADVIDIYDPPIHSALVKRRTKYINQSEVRSLWQVTRGNQVKVETIPKSNAGTVCRKFRVINP